MECSGFNIRNVLSFKKVELLLGIWIINVANIKSLVYRTRNKNHQQMMQEKPCMWWERFIPTEILSLPEYGQGDHFMTLSFWPMSMNASTARLTSSSVWQAESWTRIRAFPRKHKNRFSTWELGGIKTLRRLKHNDVKPVHLVGKSRQKRDKILLKAFWIVWN